MEPLTVAQVIGEEYEVLLRPHEEPAALCLSGGGIRSATFGLGVLQGLARIGWLEKFHYLSTVSGGGYIGSWLSSWISWKGTAAVIDALRDPLTYRHDDNKVPQAEPPPIIWLRMYSSYLSPKRGMSLDFLTLVATFLRNLLLNWAVLLPLIAAILLLPRLNVAFVEHEGPPRIVLVGFLVSCLLGSIAFGYAVSDLPADGTARPRYNNFAAAAAALILGTVLLSWVFSSYAKASPLPALPWSWLAYWSLISTMLHLVAISGGLAVRADRRNIMRATPSWNVRLRAALGAEKDPASAASLADKLTMAASGLVTGVVLFCLCKLTWPLLKGSGPSPMALLYATLAVPSLLGACWLWIAVFVGLVRRVTSEDDREWWGRASACLVAVALVWAAGHTLVIFGPPLVTDWLVAAGGVGGVGGLVTALIGYFNKSGQGIFAERQPGVLALTGRTLLNLGGLIFVVALLLVMSVAESAIFERLCHHHGYVAALHYTSPWLLLGTLAFCVMFSIGASLVIGTNTFSLHGMYGSRLVRAYLGAANPDRRPHRFTGFDPRDNVLMKDLREKPAESRRLFHIVNTTLNLVKGERLQWQQRKAESFTISPLHCGSLQVGYQPTQTPGSQRLKDDYACGMTLGRAMTISGAAASPNMGYHSSSLVTFVMAFFNARLGWWLPNPREPSVATRREPPGAGALIREALGLTTDQSNWVYLSDGGHFENLGLYEMIVRRCRKIVVVDAGSDPEYAFEDLENAIRKIRSDFGINIEFPKGLPKPETAQRSDLHYSVGTIYYSQSDSQDVGEILYLKPVLSGDEPIDVRRYAETHADRGNKFPHQSTADQFFDEAQFESYRVLGLHSVLNLHSHGRRFAWDDSWREWTPPPPPPPGANGSEPVKNNEPDNHKGAAGWLTTLMTAWPALVALASVPPATAVLVHFVNPPPIAPITATPTPTIVGSATPSPTGSAGKPSTPTPSASGGVPAPPTVSPPPPTVPSPIQDAEYYAPVVIQPAEDGRIDRVMLPIFEEASGCDGNAVRCKSGLLVDDASKRVLHRLADVLVDCTDRGHTEIRVGVRGFASSSELKGAPEDSNKDLANIRAQNVAEAINYRHDGSPVAADPTTWTSLAEMEHARHYVDVDSRGGYWRSRGILNRRAEVIFPAKRLGTCELEQILGGVFPHWNGGQ